MLKYILIVLSLMLHHLDAVETPEMLNAFAVTKQRARDKDPESQFLLYQYYLAGKFVRKNEIRALTWLKRSSRNGNLEATLELLQRYIRGEGFLKNEKKAFQMAQKLSDNKIPVGDYFVGDMTLKGIGTKKDPEKGFALIRKSAMNGFPQAARYLAWCYYSGEGITKSVELSLAWITLADRMVKDKDIQAFKNSLLRTMKPGQITYAQKHFQEIVEEFQNKHKDSIAEQSDQIKDYQEQQMQTLRDQKLALVSFVFVRQGIGKGPSKIDIHLDKLGKSEKIIDLLRIKSEFIKQETYNTVMAVGYGKYTSYVPKTEYQDHYVSYYIANMAFEAGDYSFVAKVKKRTHKFEKMKVRKGKVYILDHTWRHERGFSNTDFKSKYLDQQVMIHAKQSLKYLADKELVQRVKDYKEE
ncbi:sel1 repeat family protein, partial [bacterium]|nr:sel1 repeat family protein [bacterium]